MPSERRRLVILGATGTVGRQALQILQQAGSPLQVVGLTAHDDGEGLSALHAAAPGARAYLTGRPEERDALLERLATGDYEVCLNAVVGAAGLPYSLAVLAAGRQLALANKESLVMAGGLLAATAARTGGVIVPVDSEHSAIHQCLRGVAREDVRRIYLTASGGALRDLPMAEFATVGREQVLDHPNWDMGPRITVDSATMMNKAFEVLEAHHLFGVPAVRVEVLLHRQSVVHSMVELVDGSMLAQLGPPDMALPIHYALHYPERVPTPLAGFEPQLFRRLSFEEPEPERYPALALGWRAAEMGPAAGAALNAADEIAVEAFLDGRIPFPEIAEVCARTLDEMPEFRAESLDQVWEADAWARRQAGALLTGVRSS